LAKAFTVERVVNAVAMHARLVPDAEITLEANPTSSELSKLR
jgi:coproporphyrinogen III oxidase-like Fe-S oxidoreductase